MKRDAQYWIDKYDSAEKKTKRKRSSARSFFVVVFVLLFVVSDLGILWNLRETKNADEDRFLSKISENETVEESSSENETVSSEDTYDESLSLLYNILPEYDGDAYVTVNNNEPLFTEEEYTTESFESYSDLDNLGRCGTAYACIGTDLMPTEERQYIGMIHPTGWHTVKYDESVIEDLYLYNRCHLIAFQLAGENANEKNLITGTRYMNTEGMLSLEEEVGDYVRDTNHHVLYRVTPYFEDEELLARGVFMEALSMEDEEICFFVFCYNVQPGIILDYATGDNWLPMNERCEKVVDN